MTKLLGACAVLFALMSPAFAQDYDHHHDDDRRQYHRYTLPSEDQEHFDSYYSRWIDYRRTNNREQVESMEKRMRHVMSRNHIPQDVPFDEIATNAYRDHDHDHDRDRDQH